MWKFNVQVQAILPKSEWSCKPCFLKEDNNFFQSDLSFWLRFPFSMSQAAYASRRRKCKSTQIAHDSDMAWSWSCDLCRFHRPDIDFWWDQQCWTKMCPFKFACKGVYCKKFQLFTTIATLGIEKLQYHP